MKNNYDKKINEYYTSKGKMFLDTKTPVIIKLEGCNFKAFTKGFKKPFDEIFIESMAMTMKRLCESIQGCVFGYTHSDEIILILCDYQTPQTEAWYGYEVQKICSIATSMCSRFFHESFYKIVNEKIEKMIEDSIINRTGNEESYEMYINKYFCGDFDCQVFNVPTWEVANCIIWRQKLTEKNAVLSFAQTLYTQKQLNGIYAEKIKEMMYDEHGLDWETVPTAQRRGIACIKPGKKKWKIDYEMPVVAANRQYVEKRITFD